MAFLTREEVYNKIVTEEKPLCPHCGMRMVIWECPPINFADGLGWGSPFLYVCFNDECPLYVNGWKNIMDNFSVHASYRCICDPTSDSGHMDCMPVFSSEGGKGCIVDEELRAKEKAREKACIRGFEALEGFSGAGDAHSILAVILDEYTLPEVACRAAELIGEIGTLDVVEPLRNTVFGSNTLNEKVEGAIGAIHTRYYTKECPFCAEIIKARAVVCKHCGKDLPKEV